MIAKYQKEQTVTRLKRAYSTLAQATNKAIADYGPIKTWEKDNSTFAVKYLVPYLSISKNCEFVNTNGCSYIHHELNAKNTDISLASSYYRFYLNDGTFVGVRLVTDTINRTFTDVYVDINGIKKPNTFGKDLFIFRHELTSTGRFFPIDYFFQSRDSAMTNSTSGCNKNAKGLYCSTVIMKDGWRIADDYPW